MRRAVRCYLRTLACQLPRHPRNTAFELSYARLAGVTAHDCHQYIRLENDLLLLQAIRFDLPRQQVLTRDCELLVIEIPGDTKDLHPVTQRLGNPRQ